MAEVGLVINAREYKVTCDDGQEDHLRGLGAILEEHLQELVSSVGQVGEARLLMMAGLLIADELKAAQAAAAEEPGVQQGSDDQIDSTALALESCARRLEAIAARLEAD